MSNFRRNNAMGGLLGVPVSPSNPAGPSSVCKPNALASGRSLDQLCTNASYRHTERFRQTNIGAKNIQSTKYHGASSHKFVKRFPEFLLEKQVQSCVAFNRDY